MKPESGSKHLLSITQAKAKMYEYDVPEENHIPIARDPAHLFTLAIGMLGDLAALINSEQQSDFKFQRIPDDLSFSARFFDSYFQTKLNTDINPYLRLLGSAAYYLSALPGSSFLLAKNLNDEQLDMEGAGLEKLLLWMLLGEYNRKQQDIGNVHDTFIQKIQNQFQQFFLSGIGVEELFKSVKDLRTFIYNNGTPRQLLLVDIIGAVTRRKYENSTWFCLPKYSNLTTDIWKNILQKPNFSIKELWPAQHLLGQHGVFRGKSAIVQMPTSAGKTKATEIIIRSAFLSNRTSLAVIVAPFRALCHEIRESFKKAFRSEGIYVNELSDVLQLDYSVNIFIGRKQILVVTPEKLNYVLRHTPELGENIGLIIYDEGHQFDNGLRGITYELLLTSLKEKLPPGVQSILISAVISNGKVIGEWLNGEDSETIIGSNIIPTFRSLAFTSWIDRLGRLKFVNLENPDEEIFFVPRVIEQIPLQLMGRERKKQFFPEKNSGGRGNTGKDIALFLGLRLAKNGSVAIFCGKKDSVSKLCERVVDIYNRGLPLPSPYHTSKNRVEHNKVISLLEGNLGAHAAVTDCARHGIFAHHNNVPHGIRLAIEYALKEDMIDFVICTSTLAQGVNLPLRYLIVTSIYQGEEQIKVRDFQNLIGRSGRAGLHTEGSIIFSDPEIVDSRTRTRDLWRWEKVKTLLNPSHSEPCHSTLSSIFTPIKLDGVGVSILIDSNELIRVYPQGPEFVKKHFQEYFERFQYDRTVRKEIMLQIDRRLTIISCIESFLMAHCDETYPNLDEEKVVELAKGTLAYYMSDKEQKSQIEELFKLLSKNIVTSIPDSNKRIIFGRTLFGLYDSLEISNWLVENIGELTACNDEFDLLKVLFRIMVDNMHNSLIRKCSEVSIVYTILVEWIRGRSYHELFTIVDESGAKFLAGTQLRRIKLDQLVDMCDNGFAYEGTLIVGAILDYLSLIQNFDVNDLLEKLQILQKRIKYGLPSITSITLYEMGFSDRIVSMSLEPIFINVIPDKDSFQKVLRAEKEMVLQKLSIFPSYFSEVYRNLTY